MKAVVMSPLGQAVRTPCSSLCAHFEQSVFWSRHSWSSPWVLGDRHGRLTEPIERMNLIGTAESEKQAAQTQLAAASPARRRCVKV